MVVRVGRAALRVAAAYRALADRASGGVVLFVGRVRPDRAPRGTVAALEYEADPRLARAALRALERSARRRYGARRIVLWHRVGVLRVGTPSVIVGVAAPHRAAAFRAARWLIAALKRSAPIWKMERARSARRRPRPPSPRAGP
jgi:molybdopterin synthase catalytic subunit